MSETNEMSSAQYWHLPRLIVAWAVAAILGVLTVTLVSEENRASWLALAIGLATLITFALQLGTAQREGFITRTSFSVAGSVIIIGLIELVNVLLLD